MIFDPNFQGRKLRLKIVIAQPHLKKYELNGKWTSNGLLEGSTLTCYTSTSALYHMGLPNSIFTIFLVRSNFILFWAWQLNLPMSLWSGIPILTPPWPQVSGIVEVLMLCHLS